MDEHYLILAKAIAMADGSNCFKSTNSQFEWAISRQKYYIVIAEAAISSILFKGTGKISEIDIDKYSRAIHRSSCPLCVGFIESRCSGPTYSDRSAAEAMLLALMLEGRLLK